jgi:hypothetical protein
MMRLTGGIGADIDDASAVAAFDDNGLGEMRAFLALLWEFPWLFREVFATISMYSPRPRTSFD